MFIDLIREREIIKDYKKLYDKHKIKKDTNKNIIFREVSFLLERQRLLHIHSFIHLIDG